MRRLGWWSWGAAAALALCASPARGAGPDDADRARLAELLRAGAQAAKSKQWTACIDALAAALAIEDAATTSGELGLCEEQAGRFAAAHAHLLHARLTAPAGDGDREPFARYQQALARVTERVAVVFVSTRPTDARVLLDGRPLGAADGTHVAVEPGKHVFAARRDGHDDATDERVFKAGSTPHVHLKLTPRAETAEAAKPAPAPAAEAEPGAPSGARGGEGGASAAGSAPGAMRARTDGAPWYQPAWSPSGVLVSLAYASTATALVSLVTMIGFDVDRTSLRRGLSPATCAASAATRPDVCATVAERYDQRNLALGIAIGTLAAGGLFAGAARLSYGAGSGGAGPAVSAVVSPFASAGGGGFVLVGTW